MDEREVFLDTGYLIALENADDANHPVAREYWTGLRTRPAFTTTSYVLDEVVTFFNVRGGEPGHRKAVELGERLLGSPSILLVHVDETLLRRGLRLLRERTDRRYSLTECVSFVLMRERNLAVAYAFDCHFEQEGFSKKP